MVLGSIDIIGLYVQPTGTYFGQGAYVCIYSAIDEQGMTTEI
jgi:hypothetical protein